MRRQYHPHQTERGLLIWDIHRLVELSRELPVIEVPIETLPELDSRSWFETSHRSPSCREVALHAKLIEEADLAYPIIQAADGRVMDGMHRLCKAWMHGDKTIRAVRFENDPSPDHIDVSLDDLPYDEP